MITRWAPAVRLQEILREVPRGARDDRFKRSTDSSTLPWASSLGKPTLGLGERVFCFAEKGAKRTDYEANQDHDYAEGHQDNR